MSGEGPDLATTNARSEAATMELLHAALFAEFRGQQDDADAAPTTSGADGDGSGGGGGGGERTAGQGGDTQQQPARRPDAANAARIFAALRSLAESRGEVRNVKIPCAHSRTSTAYSLLFCDFGGV